MCRELTRRARRLSAAGVTPWGFRGAAAVQRECLPTVQKVADTIKNVPYCDVETQLASRDITVGEFKEGAVLAYNRLAEVWSAPSRPCAQGLAVCVEEEGGEARTQPRPVEDVSTAASAQPAKDEDIEYFDADALALLVDGDLCEALLMQRNAFDSMKLQPMVKPLSVRATPMTVVVAPSQRLSWRHDKVANLPYFLQRLTRAAAVLRGMWSAVLSNDEGAGLAVLVDVHFEVEQEEFRLIDLETEEDVVAHYQEERDHVWTFMAKIPKGGLTNSTVELEFVVRDMNYFVSHCGVIDETYTRV